ncbi:MAG: hypothetical protein RIT43_1028 [Bacteroidota bacterium]|jgi:uncharacterized membrane protein YfcA
MFILSLLLALLVGLSLGLIGSGGSVLTLPIMVYLLGVSTVLATSYSLFVVGVAAMIGAFQAVRKGNADLKMAVIFGLPSIAGVYVTRAFILPSFPVVLFNLGDFEVKREFFLMILFAFLMLFAAISMIRSGRKSTDAELQGEAKMNYAILLAEGLLVGAITGLVGAGGGFLIIPVLVLMSGMPMKKAVGTSLIIIAAKSAVGFLGDIQSGMQVDLPFLMTFSFATSLGIIFGSILSERISAEKLKSAFGWFVLSFAIFILFKEISGI